MSTNVGARLTLQATLAPDRNAIASPLGSHRQRDHRSYETISMGDLDRRSSSIAAGLQRMGIGPGKRIGLLVRFGEDFIALVFAVLESGATLVLIDPGMGRKNLIDCLAATQPDGFIAIPLAHAILKCFASKFPNAKLNVTAGRRWIGMPSPTLAQLENVSPSEFRPPSTELDDPAAIIFTTGSTGPPKGVLYTHRTFNAQIDQVAEHYEIKPGGIDLSCFPLFGLFNAVMGTTTVLPDMNPIRPADVDPTRLLDAIDQWQINQSFGSRFGPRLVAIAKNRDERFHLCDLSFRLVRLCRHEFSSKCGTQCIQTAVCTPPTEQPRHCLSHRLSRERFFKRPRSHHRRVQGLVSGIAFLVSSGESLKFQTILSRNCGRRKFCRLVRLAN